MKTIVQYVFRTLIRGIIISLVIACTLIAIEAVLGRTVVFDSFMLIEIGYYCIYGVVLTFINAAFFDYVNRRIVWNKYARVRWLISAAGSVVLTMGGVFLVRILINVGIEGESFGRFLDQEQASAYVVPLFITLFISLFFHAFYFYKKHQENKVREQKIIAGTASAQFESLKSQIDPHFLFNSLNVLSSLIEENTDNARLFTTSLSKVYRYVLEQKDKEVVSVSEELSFAETYMNLLKMRFENSVFYTMPETISNPEAKIVPLSLQLLLENTVKHNVASDSKPLFIRIYEQDDYLVIENDYQKKEVMQDRPGVGLQNIIDRYAIISSRKVDIVQSEQTFSVALPLLTKQISGMEPLYQNDDDLFQKAQKKVDEIKGFYGNLLAYIIVNCGLIILNLVTSPSYYWFIFPMMGWGIGVLVHGLSVYNCMPFMGDEWEERKIREIMERDKTNKWR